MPVVSGFAEAGVAHVQDAPCRRATAVRRLRDSRPCRTGLGKSTLFLAHREDKVVKCILIVILSLAVPAAIGQTGTGGI